LLLLSSSYASISLFQTISVNAQTTTTTVLNQYDWPQFQGDSSYTRYSAGPAPNKFSILWETNITEIQPYISAFNGKIYVCSRTTAIALDQKGKIVWQTDFPVNTTWPVAYKIDNSHMIVENYCFNPETGALLWTSEEFNAFTGIFNSNVYSPEEKMFYTKVGTYIEAWDFSNPAKPPTRAWSTYIRGGGITGIGTTYGDGKVFTGSFENQQLALDAKTGEILWTTLTKGPMVFNGAYSDGRYFKGGTDDNTMYCFNATNGEILWTYKPDTNGYFTTGCAVAYGIVYEMNKDGFLYAFDVETGEVVWKYKGPNESLMWPGFPTVADGKLYMTTGQSAQYNAPEGISEFSCLNAYTGETIWSLTLEALPPRESVAIAYGMLLMIPGDVTTAVDTISGTEYTTANQIWAIGEESVPVSSWPMWRADSAHSSTASVGPANLSLTWKFETNGSVISSPSVVDGIVYVGSQDKSIYAIGAWSGALIWKYETLAPIESSPAVVNGRVYTGGDDGYVYCLDAYKGTLIWKTFVNGDLPFSFGNLVLKSSPAVADGIVYVGSLDNYTYAINANNGDIVWKAKTEGPISSSPAVAGGAVYILSEEPETGAFYKFDAKTGDVIWKKEFPYRISFAGGKQMMGSPSVVDGMVFASSNWGDYFCIDTETGEIKWTFSNPTASEFIVSSPIYVDGKVFIIDKFNLACLDATNGYTIWTTYTGDELYVAPSYADGKVYMVTSQRNIFVLDVTNNGTKIATATTGSSSWSSPTIANGRLYVGCHDWNIYCYSESYTQSEETPTATPTSTSTPYELPLQHIVLIAVVVILAIIAISIGYLIWKRTRFSISNVISKKPAH
jgi:outer membrane protein assembly factor BamB